MKNLSSKKHSTLDYTFQHHITAEKGVLTYGNQ